MDKLPLISSPFSEAWPTWLMFALLVCIVMAEALQPETIRTSFRTTFSRMQRMYGDSAVNFWGLVALTLFRLCVVALTLYLFCYTQGEFSILTYGTIILVVIAFVAVKSLFAWIITYVFDLKPNTNLYMPQYSNLWTAACVVLYPILLLMINFGEQTIMKWIIVGIAALFCAGVIVKLLQHYFNGISSLGYILLYTLTLEIIPAVAMVWTVKQLV